jgi:signal transduction histidine kinase
MVTTPSRLYGQANYETLKSAMILQLADEVIWLNETSIEEFNIAVYDNDTVFNLLQGFKSRSLIKGKPFKVQKIKSLNSLNGFHILYVDRSNSTDLFDFSKAIENKNLLLITDNSTDTKNIMINILYDEKKKRLSFEVNKANIIIEQLAVTPNLLLLGGTEVDVRELFRDMKKQFEEGQINVEKQKAYIVSQIEKIKNQQEQILGAENEINYLKENTKKLNQQIATKENNLSQLTKNISEQQKSLAAQQFELQSQKKILQSQNHELIDQRSLISSRSNELDSLISEREKQKTIINKQINALESQEQIINLQKRAIVFVIAFVVVLALLLIVIFRIYKSRQVLTTKLEESYATLRDQHHSILELNDELNSINEKLEVKVQERTQILEERNTQLTEYAFINSHLLRAPLSQILGLSYLLTKQNLHLKDEKIVNKLVKSTENLDKIIRKISELLYDGKDFSREEIENIINKKFKPPDEFNLNKN